MATKEPWKPFTPLKLARKFIGWRPGDEKVWAIYLRDGQGLYYNPTYGDGATVRIANLNTTAWEELDGDQAAV